MSATPPEDEDDELGSSVLKRLSDEMVAAQKKFFGKGPVKARSYVFDDILLIVMRGGLTTAEKTMLEFGQHDKVRDFRQVFENEMTGRLTGMVEDVTGRKVLTYQSQIMFDPDIVIEIFFFDERARDEVIEATAVGQVEDVPVGETRSDPQED